MNLFLKKSAVLICTVIILLLPISVFASESEESVSSSKADVTISDEVSISVLSQEEYEDYVSWREDAVFAFTVEETSTFKITSDSGNDITVIEYSDGEMTTETLESGFSRYFYSGTIYFLCSESDLYMEDGVDYTKIFTSLLSIPLFFILPNMYIFAKKGKEE